MITRSPIVAALLCAVASSAAGAAQLSATSATVSSVFTQAASGDTIKLVGDFGQVRLKNRSFAQTLTIDASAASFSDVLMFTNISNVTVLGGSYGSTSHLMVYNKGIYVIGGESVSFINPVVTGFYYGTGLAASGTTRLNVTGGTFYKLHAGIVLDHVTTASLTNNRSINAVGDGIDIANSSDVVASGNSCTGSTPLIGTHPDCIQLWSSPGMAPQTNITLRDNYASGTTQGFTNFGSNGIGSSNISMINNHVDGLMSQGVACYLCTNSLFQGNVLTSLDGASHRVNLNIINGSSDTVIGNMIGAFNRALAQDTLYYSRDQLISGDTSAPLRTAIVPEPSSWALMIAGFVLVGAARRLRAASVVN